LHGRGEKGKGNEFKEWGEVKSFNFDNGGQKSETDPWAAGKMTVDRGSRLGPTRGVGGKTLLNTITNQWGKGVRCWKGEA